MRDQIHQVASDSQVIHAMDLVAGAAALSASRGTDRRVVIRTQLGGDPAGRHPAWAAVVRAADAVVVPSQADRHLIEPARRLSSGDVVDCADAALVAEELFRFEGADVPPGPETNDAPILVGLSGIPESAATCSGIVRALGRHPRLRVRLAGCPAEKHEDARSGRLRTALEAAAEQSGVRDRLELLPALGRRDVIDLVDGSVGVLATRQTPTNGLAALIAMHRGRAVIGVRSRTVDDIVVDSVTGRLVQPGDVPGLLEAVDELLEGSYFPLAWGMAGHERVTTRYASTELIGRLVSAYGLRPATRRARVPEARCERPIPG
jgi:hypothetical protein